VRGKACGQLAAATVAGLRRAPTAAGPAATAAVERAGSRRVAAAVDAQADGGWPLPWGHGSWPWGAGAHAARRRQSP